MRLHKIVVGLDGTPRGQYALRVAAGLAAAAGADLTALTVVERTAMTAPSALTGLITDSARARHCVRVGAASVEIARFAEEEDADLLVLGRCPVGCAALRCTGTTTEATLRRARVPVLIVPEGQAIAGPVLAAVAADVESAEVLDTALTLARHLHAELHALHVEAEYVLAGAPARSGRSVLTAAVARHPGATPTLLVRRGDPAREILEAIRVERTDLLVIGRHRGSAALDRAVDSIAARVLGQAPCAVLAVPI